MICRFFCTMTLLLSLTLPIHGSSVEAVLEAEPKMVKVYGAGLKSRQMEAYQSGFLISDQGHILTAWSYVLDTDGVTVTLHDGSRYEAELVGADPRLEIALLKINVQPNEYFKLADAVDVEVGDRVLAFSNLYGIATGDEPSSVLRGTVASKTTLSARRGVFKTPYTGPVYIIDAVTNNAGAAGGALTNREGRLAAVLGKELRSAETNAWINYAIPISEIRDAVRAMLDGRTLEVPTDELPTVEQPWRLADVGVRLVPNVLPVTPPYIENVLSGSPADQAGLKPDDLIMYLGKALVRSRADLEQMLNTRDRADTLPLAILRNQSLLTVELEYVD